jgi:hypothetical protein
MPYHMSGSPQPYFDKTAPVQKELLPWMAEYSWLEEVEPEIISRTIA